MLDNKPTQKGKDIVDECESSVESVSPPNLKKACTKDILAFDYYTGLHKLYYRLKLHHKEKKKLPK